MTSIETYTFSSFSLNLCVTWQAHSMSNAGTNGSNRLLPRYQLLSDGTRTDSCSGNQLKHQHAVLLTEYAEEAGLPLCAACARRDGRRAAALVGQDAYKEMTIDRVIRDCALCDTHGFLVTGKNADDKGEGSRQRLSKHSTIEFSSPLARPDQHTETMHLMTRIGDSKEDGQMLMKMPARSGAYALNVRYKSVAIGVDTNKWRLILNDPEQRLQRHKVVLSALRDQILSPSGAMTSRMLPHLTGLVGAIVIRSGVGPAPIYSGLVDNFVERLRSLAGATDEVFPFANINDFSTIMNMLIDSSYPRLPTFQHI